MIVALCGPSGIGKGYVKERILQIYPFIQELTWFTTRSLRPNEKRDGNRIPVSVSEFNRMAEIGELVLVQELFGHLYGLREEDLFPTRDVKLTELHPKNVSEALKVNPAIIVIGFVTPDLSLLYKRLAVVRKTESAEEIDKRVAMAEDEIRIMLQQRSLFTSVVEVVEAREHVVFDEVLEILDSHLEKGR